MEQPENENMDGVAEDERWENLKILNGFVFAKALMPESSRGRTISELRTA